MPVGGGEYNRAPQNMQCKGKVKKSKKRPKKCKNAKNQKMQKIQKVCKKYKLCTLQINPPLLVPGRLDPLAGGQHGGGVGEVARVGGGGLRGGVEGGGVDELRGVEEEGEEEGEAQRRDGALPPAAETAGVCQPWRSAMGPPDGSVPVLLARFVSRCLPYVVSAGTYPHQGGELCSFCHNIEKHQGGCGAWKKGKCKDSEKTTTRKRRFVPQTRISILIFFESYPVSGPWPQRRGGTILERKLLCNRG